MHRRLDILCRYRRQLEGRRAVYMFGGFVVPVSRTDDHGQ
jgi:hypothetical protein